MAVAVAKERREEEEEKGEMPIGACTGASQDGHREAEQKGAEGEAVHLCQGRERGKG